MNSIEMSEGQVALHWNGLMIGMMKARVNGCLELTLFGNANVAEVKKHLSCGETNDCTIVHIEPSRYDPRDDFFDDEEVEEEDDDG